MSRPVLPGRVYVVGAGPGDPDLLTLRAAAVLGAADVVFHDRLVSAEVLAVSAPGALLIDVGHRAGDPHRGVAELVERMAENVRRGKVVARLKGGDPFVFGRGAEEVLALTALGVACEVVPGISSALAGPAAAGIPVTHRGLATSVVIVTGHDRWSHQRPDWRHLHGDTVVVLMGSARLSELSQEMIGAGWDPQTPAALVARATTPAQRVVVGELADIAERAARAAVEPPALLVIGEVVSLADPLGLDQLLSEGSAR